jgi:ketosteroid isomerase-like protein
MRTPEQIAARFYDAMASGSVEDLEEALSENFVDEATLSRPESLPGGGVLAGRPAIAAFLRRAAGKAPLAVNRIMTDASGANVFATVTITLAGQDIEAIEWWSFEGGSVVSIRAFYWDTAAIVGARRG